MTKEELKRLFKDKIIPHQRSPYHFQQIEQPQYELLAYNPFCGDKYTIQLNGQNPLDKAYFHGMGCAISKASTSILLKQIEGMSLSEIVEYCQQFLRALEQDLPLLDEELSVLAALKNFDGRMDCITLPWKAILSFCDNSV